jgi:hypothetical protein
MTVTQQTARPATKYVKELVWRGLSLRPITATQSSDLSETQSVISVFTACRGRE